MRAEKDDSGNYEKKDAVWAVMLLLSIGLIIFSAASLFHKFISDKNDTAETIKKYSNDLLLLHNLDVYAINTQRFSRNIIHATTNEDLIICKAQAQSNRDSLASSLASLEINISIESEIKKSLLA